MDEFTDDTRTVERKSVTYDIKTETTRQYRCTVCEQWFADKSVIVPIAINTPPTECGNADDVALICDGCAESLFGYDGPTDGRVTAVREELRRWSPEDVVAVVNGTVGIAIRAAGKLVHPVLTVAITLGIGFFVLNEVMTVELATEISSEYDNRTFAPVSSYQLVGLLLIVLISCVILGAVNRLNVPTGGYDNE